MVEYLPSTYGFMASGGCEDPGTLVSRRAEYFLSSDERETIKRSHQKQNMGQLMMRLHCHNSTTTCLINLSHWDYRNPLVSPTQPQLIKPCLSVNWKSYHKSKEPSEMGQEPEAWSLGPNVIEHFSWGRVPGKTLNGQYYKVFASNWLSEFGIEYLLERQ